MFSVYADDKLFYGEFVYSPQPTTTEDKTEEEEVTYQ